MAKVIARSLTIAPGAGELASLQGIGVHFKVRSADTGGAVAVVEHPMEPRRLVPPHTHSREDELSYVLEGKIGARIGDELYEVVAGGYIFKPRGIKHTFWNPTDLPARVLEIIVPGGFDDYFEAIGRLFLGGAKPGGSEHVEISDRYGLSLSADWITELKERFGLRMLGEL